MNISGFNTAATLVLLRAVDNETEQRYRIQILCGSEDEIMVHTLILQALNGMALRLQSLYSADIARPGHLEVSAEVMAFPAAQREIENIVCRICLGKSISAVHWQIAPAIAV